jgi:hypothetical protein
MARSSSSSPDNGGSGTGAHTALQVLQRPTSQTNGVGVVGWQAIAKAITGSESAEIAAALSTSSRAEEVKDDDEAEKKEVEDGVTIERLSLEPQQVDVQGQKQQPARVAKMDRENGMVLVAELLRQFPEELASLKRPLEALLNKGGELVMQDREEHK